MNIFVRFYLRDQTVEQNKSGIVKCFHQKIILLQTASPQDEKYRGDYWGMLKKMLKKMQMQLDKTHKFQGHAIIFLGVIDFYVLFHYENTHPMCIDHTG